MRKTLTVLFALLCFLLAACAGSQVKDQTAQDLKKAQDKIKDLELLNKSFDGAIKRCEARLPKEGTWPNLFSMGYYGDFWITDAQIGKIIELKKDWSVGDEEQLFIVPRVTKNEVIKFKGAGLRMVDSGTIYAILAYMPPQDKEERKKQQILVISYSDRNFVIIFKPARY